MPAQQPMRKVRLGRTEQRVSAISVGTWSHGGAMTAGNQPVGWSGHDDSRASAALERAFELGLDHWDTADVYGDGRAEKLIGRLWDRVPRHRVFLASKVGWDAGPHPHAYHPEQIRSRLERSLGNLRTDRIDLYYFHRCDFGRGDAYLADAVALLRRYREEGKIRFIGLSDWDLRKIVRYAPRVDPDVVQPYRNLAEDSWQRSGLASWVEEHDAGVAFFSPLKHGLLLGKYERPVTFEPGDMRGRVPGFGDADLLARLRECARRVRDHFPGHPQPVLHALTAALLADAPSGCVLLGLRDPSQAEAAGSLGAPLAPEEAAWVADLYRRAWKG